MQRQIERIRQGVSKWGFRRTLWAAVMRRLSPWLIFCQVRMRPIQHASEHLSASAEFTTRIATEDDLAQACSEMSDQLSQDFVDAAFMRGDICCAVFKGPRMVCFQWSSFATAPVAQGLWVEFNKRYRYGYKTFTRPEYRGRRLSGMVNRFDDAQCNARGCTHTISYVETHNYASLAFGERLGNQRVGYAGYVRLFNRTYPFRTTGVKRHGFRFYRRESQD